MKKVFIIGNWKSYKTSVETIAWFQELRSKNQELRIENKEIILCVPFTVLSLAKSLIQEYNLPIKLGAQDISPFDEGKYTGEVSGKQISEFADHVMIGHSERRKYFGDTDDVVNQKIDKAFQYGLTPIVCVSEVEQVSSLVIARNEAIPSSLRKDIEIVPQGDYPLHGVATPVPQLVRNDKRKMIIAYEPLFAIGSGTADSPENAEKTSTEIQKKMENSTVIYGGSVISENVHSFVSMPSISGVLPGGASLDADEFAKIIINA